MRANLIFRPLLLLLILTGNVQAQNYAGFGFADFSLRFGNTESVFNYEDASPASKFKTDYFQLELFDEIGDNLLIGFNLGRWSGSESQRPMNAGLSFTGSNAGLALKGSYDLIGNELLWFRFVTNYSYSTGSAKTDTQETNVSWREWGGQAGLAVYLGALRIEAGLQNRQLSGEERNIGLINSSSNFSASERSGRYLNLALQTNGTGHIGVLIQDQNTDSVSFYFQRRF